jgi:hypothetical protein
MPSPMLRDATRSAAWKTSSRSAAWKVAGRMCSSGYATALNCWRKARSRRAEAWKGAADLSFRKFGQEQRSFEAFGLFRILAEERAPVEDPSVIFDTQPEGKIWYGYR